MTPRLFALAFLTLAVGAIPALADDIFLTEQKPTEYLAKDRLIGVNVHDGDGKVIGDIEDLVVDSDNKIVGAIIGIGGLLGVGEKKVAVSLPSLSIESTDKGVVITMPAATKDALTAAPAYKRANPPKGWLQRAAEKGEEIRDKSGPAYEKAKAAAKDAYESAKEKAGPALEKAKQAAQPAAPADAPKN
ncbi:PRC-barrel domain-containing protein [Hyphomicrobium denitrificans 1NES1]|uniref:PRC-barrel domain-containing protein n=1 Tax=Hyphomicrobium denitrificans 1NES1 TaxID=670307 RepID=N0B5Z7_9HYPH|nr:PRC-barrel domain-containing protein [Hyphomicrobium denitrificans]AGK58438.1 PRC-barrel domain-containing protein [Hyphomicrobium denitrificans 1NES1]